MQPETQMNQDNNNQTDLHKQEDSTDSETPSEISFEKDESQENPCACENGWISRIPIVLGDSHYHFEPKAVDIVFQTSAYRPDTILDGWETEECIIRAASTRGVMHRGFAKPRQDDLSIRLVNGSSSIVIAVADGVSSAHFAHIASTAATRYVTQYLAQLIEEKQEASPLLIDWEEVMLFTTEELVKQAEHIRPGIGRRTGDIQEILATTLVCAIISPTEKPGTLQVEVAVVGDSGVWIVDNEKINTVCGGKDTSSESCEDNRTYCLPAPIINMQTQNIEITKQNVLLIGTDGFGDPLGNGKTQVGSLYHSVLATRVPSIIEFGHMLDFTLRSFTDDRTLVAIWPK